MTIQTQNIFSKIALTDSGERLGVDGRVVHDDDEEDGEGEEDGDAERNLLAAGGRQPEDAERDDGHEDDGHHDVVPVVLWFALPVDCESEEGVVKPAFRVRVQRRVSARQLPQSIFLERVSNNGVVGKCQVYLKVFL